MNFIQFGLASAAIVTIGVVIGIAALLYVQAMIKNKITRGLVFLVVAAGVGWASATVVGNVFK